jgi:hypothetical protein
MSRLLGNRVFSAVMFCSCAALAYEVVHIKHSILETLEKLVPLHEQLVRLNKLSNENIEKVSGNGKVDDALRNLLMHAGSKQVQKTIADVKLLEDAFEQKFVRLNLAEDEKSRSSATDSK